MEERIGEGGCRMPEPARPGGGVAAARAGGREVGARLEMHKEPLAAPVGARLRGGAAPACVRRVACVPGGYTTLEGGRLRSNARRREERRGPGRSGARRREGWRPGKEGTGMEQCTLEGGRPLTGSTDGRTREGRREIETVRV